jgi:hypothetical protein
MQTEATLQVYLGGVLVASQADAATDVSINWSVDDSLVSFGNNPIIIIQDSVDVDVPAPGTALGFTLTDTVTDVSNVAAILIDETEAIDVASSPDFTLTDTVISTTLA